MNKYFMLSLLALALPACSGGAGGASANPVPVTPATNTVAQTTVTTNANGTTATTPGTATLTISPNSPFICPTSGQYLFANLLTGGATVQPVLKTCTPGTQVNLSASLADPPQ